ncbi:MAG: Fe(3+) ABC transporter substrate-binding protein, partial [Cyanobacteria bacterium P01_H01_bin.121]
RLLTVGAATTGLAATQLLKPAKGNAQSGVVNLYSSRHYNTDNELYDNFTRQTGIQVNLVEGSGDELIERISREGQNGPADVFVTVDATRLWRAQEAGILAPINSAVLTSKIPENFRDPQGRWFGFSKRARVIMYNRDRVNPAQLSTYENLADPMWRGQVLTRTSTNSYNVALTSALIVHDGEATTERWARGLVANFARQPEGNDTAQIKAVASGLGNLAIANSYYLARLAKSSDAADRDVASKIGMFFPNQNSWGTHVNISGGGVVSTAPNRSNAIQFLEYLSSPVAQTFFAQGNNEYPVVPGTPVDPVLASYGTFKEDTLNVELLGKNATEAVILTDRAGWV